MADSLEAPSKRSPGGQLQAAVTLVTGIVWSAYRSYFAGAVSHVVPAHTRDAAFQLLCDLRANTPKDRRFLSRHMRAFTPHTAVGWLALGSALGFGSCGALALSCLTVTLSIAGVWTALVAVGLAGTFLAAALGLLAFWLLVASFVSGAAAGTAMLSYVGISTTLCALRWGLNLVFGSFAPVSNVTPHHQQQQQQQHVWQEHEESNQQQQQQQQRQQLSLPPIRTRNLSRSLSPPHTATHHNSPAAAGSGPATGGASPRPASPPPGPAPVAVLAVPAPAAPAAAAALAAEQLAAAPAVAPPALKAVAEEAVEKVLTPDKQASGGAPLGHSAQHPSSPAASSAGSDTAATTPAAAAAYSSGSSTGGLGSAATQGKVAVGADSSSSSSSSSAFQAADRAGSSPAAGGGNGGGNRRNGNGRRPKGGSPTAAAGSGVPESVPPVRAAGLHAVV